MAEIRLVSILLRCNEVNYVQLQNLDNTFQQLLQLDHLKED